MALVFPSAKLDLDTAADRSRLFAENAKRRIGSPLSCRATPVFTGVWNGGVLQQVVWWNEQPFDDQLLVMAPPVP
jgi:hypothetical protein